MKQLKFGNQKVKPDIRHLKDFREAIFDQKWVKKTSPKFEAYYMYKGLAKNKEDKQKMEKAGLRYDITVIPAKKFGEEFPKTMGHYHNFPGGSAYTYPEVYEVLDGNALYFFQKLEDGKITKIFVIKAKKGDKALVPPNYGHITMNIGTGELRMANWIAEEAKSSYKEILAKKGGVYYALKSGNKIKWVKNENYDSAPEIEFRPAMNYLFQNKKNLYDFVDNLEKLEYLKNPQKFKNLWKRLEE